MRASDSTCPPISYRYDRSSAEYPSLLSYFLWNQWLTLNIAAGDSFPVTTPYRLDRTALATGHPA